MEKIRNLSLKKTIILCLIVSMVISYFAGAAVMQAAERTQKAIVWKYVDTDKYFQAVEREGIEYAVEIPRISTCDMSRSDAVLVEICDFLYTYSILLFSIIGVIVSVALFYRNKIKNPLEEMTIASRMIADNRLDFQMNYKNQDELGRLCAEFERMRAELERNNREMWRMMEREKELRAAIAHDIRAPLAVLQGYQEMLLEFLDTLDRDKIMEILGEGMGQIERMNVFIESMRRIGSLEEREIRYERTDLNSLAKQIEASARSIAGREGRKPEVCVRTKRQGYMSKQGENCTTVNRSGQGWPMSGAAAEAMTGNGDEAAEFLADADIILEVAENLLSNAVRYAKSKVAVKLALEASELTITVTDDGSGFAAGANQVTKAFYHANPQDDLNHFGMGMYISRIYCEKHGGRLLAGNGEDGGAVVRACFQVKETEGDLSCLHY